MKDSNPHPIRVPRWSFLLAALIIGALFSVLSENLTVGPSWAMLVIVIGLMIPMTFTIFRGHHKGTRFLALTIVSIVTLGLVTSVSFLMYALFAHTATAASLFRDAGLLWIVNIIVFAVWYWEVDQGGPIRRHSQFPERPDFLFPQLAASIQLWENWTPSFADYLFLAFNSSTAFSPTDTMVLSKRAKLLMMMQSAISLLIVAVLAARAINIA